MSCIATKCPLLICVLSDDPGDYKYGCIFCPAQGQSSQPFNKLDNLLSHIVAKHKTSMITPEVLQKTKCSIGIDVLEEKNWDINIPASASKGASAEEFFSMAKRIFNRRKKPVEVVPIMTPRKGWSRN
jgi:hypothetical protein